MSEPSVEEIVARCEMYQYSLPRDEQRALIASWRARGDEEREKVARWMIAHSYATGHGDTIEDLLVELAAGATCRERAENRRLREALRQIAEGQMVGYEAQTIARAALKDRP